MLISAAIRAKGAQFVIAQGIPMRETRIVAEVVVWTKKVSQVRRAKRAWERSQARRRVSQGICRMSRNGRVEQRRVRAWWREDEVVRMETLFDWGEDGVLLWLCSK